MMPYILIQENEGITKFFTFMLEGYLNKVMELNAIFTSSWDICIHLETYRRLLEQSYGIKCNIYIILGYLHSP